MVWVIRIFFLILIVAVVLWIVLEIHNRMQPVRELDAVVEKKYWTRSPYTQGFKHKYRRDCTVGFQVPDREKLLELSVAEDVYDALVKKEAGVLTVRGDRFLAFTRPDGTQVVHKVQAEPEGEPMYGGEESEESQEDEDLTDAALEEDDSCAAALPDGGAADTPGEDPGDGE